MTTFAEGMLRLLAAEPMLLPSAPATGNIGQLISERTSDEVHQCLRCGCRAAQAFVAATEVGPRWLDLCMACSGWLRSGVNDQ